MQEKYMKLALKEANKAFDLNECPIGVVIVKNGTIIAKAYNKKNQSNNPLDHAEILAIKKACRKLQNWRLTDCEIYITLEPCPMCASAIKQARIKKVYFGSYAQDKNNSQIIDLIFHNSDINSAVEYTGGIMESECTAILKKFFKNKRKDK